MIGMELSKHHRSTHADSAYQTMQGPAPCDDCPQSLRCRDRLLACSAFAAYAQLVSWASLPREPSRWQYRAIFSPKQLSDAVVALMRTRQRQTKAERGTYDGRRRHIKTMEAVA